MQSGRADCRRVNLSEATIYRCEPQYGALELDDVKELKALREENGKTRLKRLVAFQVLKEVNSIILLASRSGSTRFSVVASGLWSRQQARRCLGLSRPRLSIDRGCGPLVGANDGRPRGSESSDAGSLFRYANRR